MRIVFDQLSCGSKIFKKRQFYERKRCWIILGCYGVPNNWGEGAVRQDFASEWRLPCQLRGLKTNWSCSVARLGIRLDCGRHFTKLAVSIAIAVRSS